MGYDIGPKIGIEGEAEFRKAINALNTSFKTLGTEMAVVTSQFDKNDKSSKVLTAQNGVLNKQIDTQRQKLEQLTLGLAQSAQKYGTNDATTQKWQQSVNRATTELNKMELELKNNSEMISTQNNEWTRMGNSLDILSNKMKKIGSGMSELGKNISLALTVPIVGLGVSAVKTGMEFESAMSRVKAISEATGEQFEKLNNQALQLGQDTEFSATEAASGMENLASAGFSVEEIMKAMPGMLDLAASGGLDIATASDIAASALRSFGLESNQSGHFADVLAKAAADTNAGVTDMGMALKYAAPPAHALGMSVEEVSAAIGEMANVGIKGEQAGTTLRGSLVSLASPSKDAADAMQALGFNAFDAQGKMLPFGDVIGKLQQSISGLTDEKKADALATIFGREALSGMMALVDAGPEKFEQLKKSFENSDGAAKKMAGTMQDNTKSSIEQMMGSLEAAAIKIQEAVAPTIRKFANTIQELANGFSNLSPEIQETIIKVALAVAAIGPALIGIGSLVTAISAIQQALSSASLAMAATGSIATLAIPVIIGLGVAFGAMAFALSSTKNETKELSNAVEEDKQAWADLQAQQAKNAEANTAEIDHTKALWKELQTLVGANGEVLGSKERVKYITEEMNKLAPGAIQWINGETLAYQESAAAIDNLIAKKRAQIILESQEPDYKEAILKQGKKEQEQAALSMEMAQKEMALQELQSQTQTRAGIAKALALSSELDSMQKSYADNEAVLGRYYSTIEGYEADSAAVTSSNFEKIKEINAGTVTSHKDATNGTLEELKKQAVNAEVNAMLMRERYHSGVEGVTADMVKTAEDAAKTANTEYEKIGGNIVDGTKKGVNNKKGGLVTTITDMAKEAVKAAKKALDIHSPSRVFTEIGENVGQGLVNGIEGSRQIVAQSAKVIGEVLIKEEERIQKQIAEIDKAAIEKQQAESTQKYKEELAKKNAELATAEKDGKQKILNEISKLQSERESSLAENSEKNLKDSLNNQLKVVQNFKKEYEDAVESVRKDQDNMTQKLEEFGELFERTKTEYSESFKIRDLQNDIDQITAYGKALEDLKAKGAPADLLAEVENMGVQDGLDFAKNLVTMTDENYTEYIAKWTEKQEAAKKVAQQFYSSELENLKTEFVDKIPTELSAVKDEMRGIGVNAGRGLASGFQSQSEHIKDTFVGVLENALAEAKKSMDIHSPSRKWAEVGKFMAAGLGVGFTSQMQGVVKQINDSIPANVTMTGQYRATAKMGEGIVNGLAGIMPQQNSQPIIVQTILDGKVIAQSLYDPLQGVAKQRGVVPVG